MPLATLPCAATRTMNVPGPLTAQPSSAVPVHAAGDVEATPYRTVICASAGVPRSRVESRPPVATKNGPSVRTPHGSRTTGS